MKKIHKTKQYKIPTPKFYVLYNGEGNPKQDYLKLSDSFKIESDELALELKVKVLNINYSEGGETLEKKPFSERLFLPNPPYQRTPKRWNFKG